MLTPVGMDTVRGRAASEDSFKAVFDTMQMTCDELRIERVHQVGDAAFVETQSIETLANAESGSTDTGRYRELFCLERANGDWRIASYMFNQ